MRLSPPELVELTGTWTAVKKTPTVDSQLYRGDLQRIDPVQQGSTIPPDLTGSSLLPLGENDADI